MKQYSTAISLLFCLSPLISGCASSDLAMAPALITENPAGDAARGTKPFQGIPSIAVSKSGKRVFAAWYGNGKTENTENYVMLAYGDAQLENFTDVKMIAASPHIGKVRLFDPAMWTDPQGRIWLFWGQSAGALLSKSYVWHPAENGIWDRRGGVWCVVCENPDDERPKWSKPRRISDGVMLNKPEVLRDGTWLLPVAVFQTEFRDAKAAEEGAWAYATRDGGKTFKKLGGLRIPDTQYPEHMFAQKADSDIVMFARRQAPQFIRAKSGAKGLVYESYANDGITESVSKDGGLTWSEPQISKIPHQGSRFYIGRLSSGNWLLIKNDANDAAWLQGLPRSEADLAHFPRNRLVAYISEDEGLTWKGGLLLDERNSVSYPDASQSAEGFIYAVYDRGRYSQREILAAKFTEEDVLAGKLVDGASRLKIICAKAGLSAADLKAANAQSRQLEVKK